MFELNNCNTSPYVELPRANTLPFDHTFIEDDHIFIEDIHVSGDALGQYIDESWSRDIRQYKNCIALAYRKMVT